MRERDIPMLACSFVIASSLKRYVKSLKGFDFGHIQTADIGVKWP